MAEGGFRRGEIMKKEKMMKATARGSPQHATVMQGRYARHTHVTFVTKGNGGCDDRDRGMTLVTGPKAM